MSNEKKYIVLGLNEIEHERLQLALERYFKTNNQRFETQEKQLPETLAYINYAIEYLKAQLESVNQDENPHLYRLLSSTLQTYELDFKPQIEGQITALENGRKYYERSKEFVDKVLSLTNVTSDDNKTIIEYTRTEALEWFLDLIVLLDLDGKRAKEQEKLKRELQEQSQRG